MSLVGINLLQQRELDIPEVSLVVILDADKEGFLRSDRSLIQTIGRAARNAEGASHYVRRIEVTPSMEGAIRETETTTRISRCAYNQEHGITPKTIVKKVCRGSRNFQP